MKTNNLLYGLKLHITNSILPTLVFCLFSFDIKSQDTNFVRQAINQLASDNFHGRGYVNNGDAIAADYLKTFYKKQKLKKFKRNYFQSFTFPINSFPGKIILINGTDTLKPGIDFIVAGGSSGIKGFYDIVRIDKEMLDDSLKVQEFKKNKFSDVFVVVDAQGMKSEKEKKIMKSLASNPFNAKGIIMLDDGKLMWSLSQKDVGYALIEVRSEAWNDSTKQIYINIDQKLITKHKANNVIGFIKGTQHPDSFIVFTAHYDHLGRMGQETVFNGANDNASGTAMLMDLIRYYKNNQPKYSIAFIAFAGEEAGLIGSKYYVENPMFEHQKIKCLLNLDLMGFGEDGITIVNSKDYPNDLALFREINEKEKLLPAINMRSNAKNSDHYPFTEKNVKAFFIYTQGNSKYYHDIYDRADTVPLSKYNEIFKLITTYVSSY
ncbi:MAG: M28 family metallopeptidase [Bacteroidia bacterium]